MSSLFFPVLHTSNWKMSRTPQWGTTVHTASPGDRTRAPLQSSPRWRWKLQNGVLQTAFGDLQAIQNLYTAMYGRLDFFLWKDPEGESIVDPTVQVNVLGNYYWPVAFTEDSMDFDRFAFRLWECGTCEFEQVLAPQTTGGGGGGGFTQFPNGLRTGAVLSFVTTHIQGTGYTGIASVSLGSGFTLFDSSAYSSRTDTSVWTPDTNQWSAAVGPLVITADPTTARVKFFISGSIGGTATPSDKLRIHDVFMNVTYEDGTITTFRPTASVIETSTAGTIANPADAIDGDPSSYAEISKTAFGGTDGPVLEISGFTS